MPDENEPVEDAELQYLWDDPEYPEVLKQIQ
jgi:hypothetical protein